MLGFSTEKGKKLVSTTVDHTQLNHQIFKKSKGVGRKQNRVGPIAMGGMSTKKNEGY